MVYQVCTINQYIFISEFDMSAYEKKMFMEEDTD